MAKDSKDLGIIYVLTNQAMPGLVKIGKTKKPDVMERLQELYSTGVPVPFECVYARRLKDVDGVERDFHDAFKDKRLSAKREFFAIEPEQAINLLKRIPGKVVTQDIKSQADSIDPKTQKRHDKLFRRSPLSFAQMGLQIGDQLIFANDTSVSVTVIDVDSSIKRKVKYKGKAVDFTELTNRLLGKTNANANHRWLYKGQRLTGIFSDYHDDQAASPASQPQKKPRPALPSAAVAIATHTAPQAEGKRPPLSFAQLGLQVGDQLIFANNTSVSVTVIDVDSRTKRKVKYQGKVVNFTELTNRLLGKTNANPNWRWLHNGRRLKYLFDDYYKNQT